MGGSSHWWRAARATTGASGIRHTPRPSVSVRRAPHRRGQRLQIIGFLLLPRFAGYGRGQAPPPCVSAPSPRPPTQAGAAGALQRKPPPPGTIGRTTWGRFQRWGPGGPLFGRFKGMGAGKGKSKSPLPGRLFRPFLSAQKGARRRHDKETGVKKGNMEGASAWNKTGRCGQKVNCPRGAREAALGRRPLRNRPVPRYHGVGATLVVAPRAAIKAAPTGPGYRQTSRRSVRPISQSTDTP